MNFWNKITGNDMNADFRRFEARVKKLPLDYQETWEKIKYYMWPHSNLTGRNLMQVFAGILDLLEESVVEGISAQAVIGDDVEGFCTNLIGAESSNSYRNIWRKQLNKNIHKRLGK